MAAQTTNNGKLMEMLTGYAASHQHPFNVVVHLIGIPTIMLGVMIPLTWVSIEVNDVQFNLAHVLIVSFFLFYATLDFVFAVTFLVGAWFLAMLAAKLGAYPGNTGWIIAAVAFFGGYAAQFIGHAVEKSMPVLVKHPVQANLAAPFFTVVELFSIVGLRNELFEEVQNQIEQRRAEQTG
ncbi:MAG: Mpo1-like protein [Woeseiaceae bacterium]